MVATVFAEIPNIGIKEEWVWKTDIITTIKGDESRSSIRPRPRIKNTASFGPLTQAERISFYNTLSRNAKIINDVPLYQYSTPITQDASATDTRVYFNPSPIHLASGGQIILINPRTGAFHQSNVAVAETDGAQLSSALTQDIDTGWLACLSMSAKIDDASFRINQITGEIDVTFLSWVDPAVQRSDTAASLTTLDGLTVLEREFLAENTEDFSFNSEVIDFDAGIRREYSQWEWVTIKSEKQYRIQRVLDTTDFDYWRLFFDTVKGAQKAFLISTQMKDMTLQSALTQGGTTMSINEDIDELLHAHEQWKHFEIKYTDGTFSRHTISNSTGAGPVTVTFAPALPSDPKVANVERISHLLKSRMSDTITFEHGALVTIVSIETTTTDSG